MEANISHHVFRFRKLRCLWLGRLQRLARRQSGLCHDCERTLLLYRDLILSQLRPGSGYWRWLLRRHSRRFGDWFSLVWLLEWLIWFLRWLGSWHGHLLLGWWFRGGRDHMHGHRHLRGHSQCCFLLQRPSQRSYCASLDHSLRHGPQRRGSPLRRNHDG